MLRRLVVVLWIFRQSGSFALPLIRVRIRAEHFDEVALAFEIGDGFGDFAICRMAVAIDEEKIFPRFAFARARLDLRHVQFVFTKSGERVVQRADFMRDADHQTGAIFSGRRTALASEHEEAGGVGGIILNAVVENGDFICFRR